MSRDDLIRRGIDIALASIALLIAIPVLLLAIVAVRLEGQGPIFYRARRVGKDGREFTMWKLRTMVPQADAMGPSVTSRQDRRITRVGQVLRLSKLDEFPQLWNVVLGDMTLVGPRPEAPELAVRYTPEQRRILAFTPGVTSPGSLHYAQRQEGSIPSDESSEAFYLSTLLDRKIEEDIEYLVRRTIRSDFGVIARTVRHIAGEVVMYLRRLVEARN